MSLSIEQETSRCVKCGLCLPECPTYQLTQNEAFSPRGRIALAAALEKGQVTPNKAFLQRMNSCLLCRRCEKICPSEVKFGAIMDQARATQKHGYWQKHLNNTISHPEKLRTALSWVQWLRPLISSIPDLAPVGRLNHFYPSIGNRLGSVTLFKGCTGETLEPNTLQSAIDLLTHSGHEVHIPPDQGCCGALHAHAGEQEIAASLRAANTRVFSNQNSDVLVSIASGCGAYLAEQEELPLKHLDICAFLAQPKNLQCLQFRPLKAAVAVHIPCSLENVLDAGQAVLDLLAQIPGLKVHVLSRGKCCGAAGTYVLTHAKTARELRQPFIQEIHQISPDYLLSSNIGCALHLSSGLKDSKLQVMHPISLLAQQLIRI